ncbi:MAG: metallophosphoesterase family protein [Hyphomicrobiales bacterium]
MSLVNDLGELSGPLFVFGGPYSNLEATRAALDEAKRLNIPSERIICTGDVTAYCGNPEETSTLIRQSGIHVVQGNCEESLAADRDDCACGFDGENDCSRLAVRWYAHSKMETSDANKNWMGSLPHRLTFNFDGKKVHVLHGSNKQINEFIFRSTDASIKRRDLQNTEADIIIAGHSGLPFTEHVDDGIWHNAGVVGVPANDGTPRIWYSLIEATNEGISFSHKSLTYDHASAIETMLKHGLDDYASSLASGIYPSQDTFAPAEQQAKGIPLQEQTIVYNHRVLVNA